MLIQEIGCCEGIECKYRYMRIKVEAGPRSTSSIGGTNVSLLRANAILTECLISFSGIKMLSSIVDSIIRFIDIYQEKNRKVRDCHTASAPQQGFAEVRPDATEKVQGTERINQGQGRDDR